MNSRPRRKCVSVSFVADEDVIQHIVDAHEKSSKKGKKSKSNTPSKDKLSYKEDLREDTPEVSEDEDETQIKAPSTLEEGNVLVGTDLFQFRTPKKSGQMAAKASESRTPKSILKKVKDLNENVTPGKDKKTPVKRKGKVKRPEATTPYRLRQRHLEVSDSEESFSSGDSEDELDSDENSTPSGRNKSITSRTPSGGSKPSTPKTPSGGSKTPSSIKRNRRQHEDTVDVPSMVQDYFDLHSEGPCATSDRTLAKLGTSKMDQETLSQLLHKIPSSHSKECTQMYTEHRSLFNQWMYQMCNNFNILLHGLGSKRTLLEDFRKTMLSELSHVVVNGYFPSLTVKHQTFFTTEIRKHDKSDCDGHLRFDAENAKQWGCVWRERLKCPKCDFVSKYYRLYDTVESNKRGPKAAKLNVQIQCGLITSPISNKNLRDILMISNIVPPSSSGMQKTANKVAKQVEELNKKSMQDIRKKLVEENRICGLSDEKLVRVESDCRYNNPLINSGTTPFQAGTQVVCTMSENNTSAKQIVSLFTGNKLCSVAARLKGKGFKIVCPNHEGVCTANIAEDASIGNEGAYSSWCATEVSDYLKISHITTDGDSRAFQGVKQVHGTNVEALRDVRHLSASMKRAITRCTFSPNLFAGTNKLNQKNRFALDIKARCVAELNQSFNVHQGELYTVKQHMPEVIKTIVMCYKGYCGSSCKVNSYVCAGLPSNHWIKNFIPNGSTCRMTCDDEVKLENCIGILLGPNSLNLVRFLTSTQKSEAFNRALSRCNPKNILNSITDEILEKEVSFKGPLDQVDYIKSEFESKDYRDFYLVMNNIDGMMLRGEKTQNILSLLSQIRLLLLFHVMNCNSDIASIDHINASLSK
ncbi:ORC2 [Mytilus edulis]|uniref:Origin recognition complex subunit 2 n=1 Tax=Mytilus edulis TaxID=6550 RepID=A0A8S3Q3N0_MYTED|nr:ORC2 [Mytilus edulis]